MAARERQAEDLMVQGDKALKKFRLFGNKYEDAVELYKKAANLFKMAKNKERAGAAFKKCAECYLNLDSKFEAASSMNSAATILKKVNPQEAITCLRAAIEYYTEEGRFNMAARYQKEVAEMYEAEGDVDASLEAYQTAADFYDGEGSVSARNNCLLKVAEFAATKEEYQRAIEIFEEVATICLDNNLLKYNAREYFLRAGICHLCLDDVTSTRRAIERYGELDLSFASQRESKFLSALVQAVEDYDPDAFTAAVRDFDSMTPLSAWKTNLLLRVKNNISQEDDIL